MTAVRLDTLQCVQQKMLNILKKDWLNQSFFIYAWRDCLDLFALNVPTCFAFVISSLGKSTPHSAHRSLEHAGTSFLARQILAQTKITEDRNKSYPL